MRQAERFVRDRWVIRETVTQFVVPAIDRAHVRQRSTAPKEFFDTAGAVAAMQLLHEPQELRMKRHHHVVGGSGEELFIGRVSPTDALVTGAS